MAKPTRLPKIATIESNRDLPERCTVRSYGEPIALFDTIRKLEVGQSFVVDGRKGRDRTLQAAYKLKIKLTSAKETSDEVHYRIWRRE